MLLLLFDVYLTWARIEKATPSSPALPLAPPPPFPSSQNSPTNANTTDFSQPTDGPSNLLASQPILVQYLFFLALCAVETASFHMPIRTLLSIKFPRPLSSVIPYYPHKALISTALLVSSFTKLFPLLLLVWNYDLPSSASAVSWAVIINNVAALEILLDCGYVRAALLAAVGAIFRAGVGWVSYFETGFGVFFLADSPLVHSEGGGCGRWSSCGRCRGNWRCYRALAALRGKRGLSIAYYLLHGVDEWESHETSLEQCLVLPLSRQTTGHSSS